MNGESKSGLGPGSSAQKQQLPQTPNSLSGRSVRPSHGSSAASSRDRDMDRDDIHRERDQSTPFNKQHTQRLVSANKKLTSRVQEVERENRDLKASVFNLSYQLSVALHQLKQLQQHERILRINAEPSADSLPLPAVSGSVVANETSWEMPMKLQRQLQDQLAHLNLGAAGSFGGVTYAPPETGALGGVGVPAPSTVGSDGSMPPEQQLQMRTHSTESNTSRSSVRHRRRGRVFYRAGDLLGHLGSVYTVSFSPNGDLVASGSFDRSVRVWNVCRDNVPRGKELLCLQEHQLNVSDLAWGPAGDTLVSGAYDRSVKLWDVVTGALVRSFELSGFVQSVASQDQNTFYAGTTAQHIVCFDTRAPAQGSGKPEQESVTSTSAYRTFVNDAMVNCVQVCASGPYLLSGDSHGQMKTWDVRQGRCVNSFTNGSAAKPISHMLFSRPRPSCPTLLSCNSYDNVLRVYEYKRNTVSVTGPSGPQSANSSDDYVRGPLPVRNQLTGHKNKNWPIKSSMLIGSQWTGRGGAAGSIAAGGGSSSSGGMNVDEWDTVDHSSTEEQDWMDHTALLATGSADVCAYVYDVTQGPGSMMQRLEGHKDRVYSVDFHPTQPILASCSADYTVKLWAPAEWALNGAELKPQTG